MYLYKKVEDKNNKMKPVVIILLSQTQQKFKSIMDKEIESGTSTEDMFVTNFLIPNAISIKKMMEYRAPKQDIDPDLFKMHPVPVHQEYVLNFKDVNNNLFVLKMVKDVNIVMPVFTLVEAKDDIPYSVIKFLENYYKVTFVA